MGILNVTPDSFYDGGKLTSRELIAEKIDLLISEGADIIDIGGYSTRPGAPEISEKEELQRLIPAMEIMNRQYPGFAVSIDTFRSVIAEIMIKDYGAGIINDITGGDGDKKMIDIIAKHKVPYIVMHIQGTPRTMQINPVYNDVINELLLYFTEKIFILRQHGIIDYIIDPGFGFGKTPDHNYKILNELDSFKIIEAPLMVGISRKSMIYKHLGTDAGHSLNGTTALHMAALMKGANILRVHDVKEAVETINLFVMMNKQE